MTPEKKLIQRIARIIRTAAEAQGDMNFIADADDGKVILDGAFDLKAVAAAVVAEFEPALEPFARVAENYDFNAEQLGADPVYEDFRLVRVTLGDCRKARLVLKGEQR